MWLNFRFSKKHGPPRSIVSLSQRVPGIVWTFGAHHAPKSCEPDASTLARQRIKQYQMQYWLPQYSYIRPADTSSLFWFHLASLVLQFQGFSVAAV